MLPETCDILVVGAGPAGSCAAISGARQGVRTVLIDSKVRIGEQPHCGEFVPIQLCAEFDLIRLPVVQAVRIMETRVRTAETNGPNDQHPHRNIKRATSAAESLSAGFLIDRVKFDRDLAREAAASGAMVVCGARLVGVEGSTWIIRHRGREAAIKAGLTVAADGAASRVGAVKGLPRSSFVKGIQVEAPLAKPLDRTLIFLDRDFVGGYGWFFPKGSVANVGLGVISDANIHPGALLDRLVEDLCAEGLLKPGILARSGGLIPVSGLRKNLVLDNVIFCGDAAGLTHPISGAGIPQAVFSGTLAGKLAAIALKSGSVEPLKDYEKEIRGWYQGIIHHARSKRLVMMNRWNHPDFQKTCECAWIGFRGYRKRVRSLELECGND
jgi:geranylgeranyl reductase family protein